MDIQYRILTPDDHRVIAWILDGAYGPNPTRAARVVRYIRVDPANWLLASAGGEPVGMGGVLDFGAYAYVGMVGVLPSVQRRGIGRALMDELVARHRARGGGPLVLDASDAGAPLYRSMGFVEDDQVHIYVPAAEGIGAGAGAGPAEPYGPADRDGVLDLDRRLCGGDRSRLLDSYLGDFGGRAFVTRGEGGRPTGFVVAQDRSVGPWLAEGVAEAGALLDAALGLDFEEPPGVAAPGACAASAALLERRGFARARSLAHMRLGPEVARRRDLVFGQASLAAG